MSIFQLALRNARAKSGRGILITIILTSMLISGVLNIGMCIKQSYLQAFVAQYSDAHAKFKNLTADQIELLENRVEVEKYILATAMDGYLRPTPDSPIRVQVQSAEPMEHDPSLTLATGRAPAAADEIALFPHTAKYLGIAPVAGERVELFLTDRGAQPEPVSLVISGVFQENALYAARNMHTVIASEAYILRHMQLPAIYQQERDDSEYVALTVWYRDGYDPYQTTEQLARLAGITAASDARVNDEYLNASMQTPQMLAPIVAILLLFILISALVSYNIFNIQLIRRVRQTGLLSVIGASRGQIFGCVCLEALMLTLAALPLGLGLGAALTRLSVAGVLNMALPQTKLVLMYSPMAFLAAAFVTLLTVFGSVLRPALRVARVAPVDAVGFSGASESTARRRRYGEVNLARLSRINLWRNKGRTLVTILALTLCGALFISVSTVGGSLMAGVDQLARRGMAGDMQITSNPFRNADVEPPLTESFVDQLSSIDGVTGVHPIYVSGLVALDGGMTEEGLMLDAEILGYSDDMLWEQLANLSEGAPDMRQMETGAALFVDFNRDERLEVGKQVTLKLLGWGDSDVPWERPFALDIVGLLKTEDIQARMDYLSPYTFIMAGAALRKLDASAALQRIAIDVDAPKHDAVAAAIRQLCNGNDQIHFQSLKDAIEEQRNNMMGLLMLLYAIIAVLGLVGFLNLANTTLVGIEQRKAELGALSALGVDGKGLRKLLWGESRRIAITCTVTALAVGGGLGYLGTLAMGNMGATYIRFALPLWQSALLALIMFAIPYVITRVAGARLSEQGAVALMRAQ